MCMHVCGGRGGGGSPASTAASSVKVSLCCQGLSLLAASLSCVCVCEADGKVDLKWTGMVTEDECFYWLRGEWKVHWWIEYILSL